MYEGALALVGLTVLLGAALLWLLLGLTTNPGGKKEAVEHGQENEQKLNGEAASKVPALKKQKQQQRLRKEKPQQLSFVHPLLAAALKGHSGSITCLDFSSNGKYLASCADDRTVRIWSTKDFLERKHRCMRANVELDHATLVRFWPDSRAFIVWLANGERIQVFRMTKKEDGSFTYLAASEEFPTRHKAPVINIGVADTGKFIMTASSDTTILIWDLKGEVLATINTNQMNNAYAAVSPCGRMATVSKDGTWKLWDTDVEYKKQQDPYLLLTGKCQVLEPCRVALSPDARTLAVSSYTSIFVYGTQRGEEEERFENVHGEPITDLAFDVNNRFLVSCGDRAIRVFHNTVGYRAVVEEMKALLKKATNESTKQRLQQQINSAQSALTSIYKSN